MGIQESPNMNSKNNIKSHILAEDLSRIQMFQDMTNSELEEIAPLLNKLDVSEGTYVISEGEPGFSVFFIFSGVMQVLARTSRTEHPVNILREGDFFGEMAVLDRLPRSASIRALSDSILFELGKDDFYVLFGKHPKIAQIILERFSERMRQTMTDLEYQLETLETANSELLETYDVTLEALSKALDLRDADTDDHSHRVSDLACRIAAYLGLSPKIIRSIKQGAMLHDVGKIGVPDAILRKPGALTEEERALMQNHPMWGYEMLKDIPFLSSVLPLILYHHEKFDGSGYPEGLKGEKIPIEARIFAIVDAYDAMTSDRPYRSRMSMLDAFKELDRCAGTHFDPKLVKDFKKVMGYDTILPD